MKQLMERQEFSKISIGEICELCRMNRKSFYYHFRDKYDLVNWIFYTEFIETVRSYEEADESFDRWLYLEGLCGYFYRNRRFYLNALEVQGQNSFRDYFRELLQVVISDYMADVFPAGDEDSRFFAAFYSDAFVVAIERWLRETPEYSPAAFVSLLQRTIGGAAIKAGLDIERAAGAPEQKARR